MSERFSSLSAILAGETTPDLAPNAKLRHSPRTVLRYIESFLNANRTAMGGRGAGGNWESGLLNAHRPAIGEDIIEDEFFFDSL